MGKKSKERQEEKSEKREGGGSSDIFKTLFGDIPQEGGLFSNNPFRRKPGQQLGLGFGSGVAAENPKDGVAENPKHGDSDNHGEPQNEVKKRKRHKERNDDNDSIDDGGSENLVEAKKRKKLKEINSNLDVDTIEKRTNEIKINDGLDVVAMERNGEESRDLEKAKNKNMKKKRKRDEVEELYEARNHGVVEKVESEEVGLGKRVVGEKRKTLDDPAEVLVSKEGFDDESKLVRTVFVGNLPLKVKKKALLKEFSHFGEIESVRIRSVPLLDSKIPRKGAIFKGKINDTVDSVHAYIVFKDEQCAKASLSHNMAVIGGNHIRVDMACPPRKKLKGENVPLYDRKRTVFVGNLPFDVKDEELYKLFCGINQLESTVEAIRVIRDPHTSVGKGIAYVLFKSRDAANLVVKKRNIKLRDRDLRLSHARSDSTPSKKRNPSPTWTDNSPAKRSTVAHSGTSADRNIKPKVTANLSYQGLQASKSGVQKKVSFRPRTGEQGNFKSKTKRAVEPKERQTKRPAVAARKVNAVKGGGGLKPTMKKRKLESRTPESSHRNKKARKLG